MKKYIIIAVTLAAMCWSGCISYAHDNEPVLVKMRATAYPDSGNLTYSGTQPHYGTAGGRKDMIGKTIIMYQRLPGDKVGEIIGIFEIEDTGPAKGAREGHVIDVWRPNVEECQEFMNRVYEDDCGGKVFVQFLEDCNG